MFSANLLKSFLDSPILLIPYEGAFVLRSFDKTVFTVSLIFEETFWLKSEIHISNYLLTWFYGDLRYSLTKYDVTEPYLTSSKDLGFARFEIKTNK